MFGKGHFEGDFRSRPKVSIRGATKAENKDQLLQRAQQDRAAREAKRNEAQAAVLIQATVRGFLAKRRIIKRILQEDLPKIREKSLEKTSDPPDLGVLHSTCVLVVRARDMGTLAWACQILVKERSQLGPVIESSIDWQFLLCRLSLMAVQFLTQATENAAPCLRFLETYTGRAVYTPANADAILAKLYRYLVSRDYFGSVRSIVDTRIPPLVGKTTRPPTPRSGEILQMIMRPLTLATHIQDTSLRKDIFIALSKSLFCTEFTEQVELFILPSLAAWNFPLGQLAKYLEDTRPGQLSVPPTPTLLLSLLSLSESRLAALDRQEEEVYIRVLSTLCRYTIVPPPEDEEEDSDADSEDMELTESTNSIILQSVAIINSPSFVIGLVNIADRAEALSSSSDRLSSSSSASSLSNTSSSTASSTFSSSSSAVPSFAQSSFSSPAALPTVSATSLALARHAGAETIRNLCRVCHQLLMFNSQALHDYSLLYSLAFRPSFLRQLWQIVFSTSQPSLFGSPVPLISIIARGLKMSATERDGIAPPLAVFCSLFRYLLVTIHDTEFYSSSGVGGRSTTAAGPANNWMPFTLAELVPMSLSLRDITLGLIELAFPESRPTVGEDYRNAVNSVRDGPEETREGDVVIWSHLFKTIVFLVRQLYTRDTRRQFCPATHWISSRITLPLDRPTDISFRRSRIRAYRPFRGLRVFTREELEERGPPLSTKEVRLATVLRELPFTISFSQRVLVFQNLIQRDKQEHQGDRVNFRQGPSIDVMVRRNYIYEDASEKLSVENEPNMRLKMRVQLVNAAGLDEAGIDGGGLFREFLSQLLKAAFDPNRGFFVLTRDQHLYPNPSASHIHQDSNLHYFFIGRMLGKALYENLLVELPLAAFFLSKLLGQRLVNVDIDHLDSLDPELYKNLLYLKTYDGDVQDLGLDFSVVVEEFGETRVELLKAEGDTIPVTSENRIEYIHLVADYKLNRQIRAQCNAFRNGLEDVIGLDWLRMFSHRELQTLISGAEHDISVEDLQNNTNYSGGFTPEHPTIQALWQVVRGMAEGEKRALLKFVTSCSRPPLLGFRDLDPPFCVHNAGSEPDRLPTASTCMNLLKLPDFQDAVILKKKLLYAIESGAGFELS